MTTAFTLAHLSDVHLAPLPRFGMRDWNVKRVLGYANWQRNRKSVHLRAVLDRLVQDMLAQSPNHIAVTGDLANIGLPSEHETAMGWLQSLGPPDRVSVVPGNHDIYVPLRNDLGTRRWSAYMTSNAKGMPFADQQSEFPFVRRFGNVALIGVNSAEPTPPFIARGRVGLQQLQHLGAVLDRTGEAQLTRVVLIHHPPLPGQAPTSKALVDADALAHCLETHGAELVLHGHNHSNTVVFKRWSGGVIPVVGITSASIGRAHKAEPLGRYNLYRFAAPGQASPIEMIGRGFSTPDSPIVELECRRLEG